MEQSPLCVTLTQRAGRGPGEWSQNREQECGLEKHRINSIIVLLYIFEKLKQTPFIRMEERKLQNVKLGKSFGLVGISGGYYKGCQTFPLRNQCNLPVLLFIATGAGTSRLEMTCPTSYGLFAAEPGWKTELERLAKSSTTTTGLGHPSLVPYSE